MRIHTTAHTTIDLYLPAPNRRTPSSSAASSTALKPTLFFFEEALVLDMDTAHEVALGAVVLALGFVCVFVLAALLVSGWLLPPPCVPLVVALALVLARC